MDERAERGGEALGGVTGRAGLVADCVRRPCRGGMLPRRDDMLHVLRSIEGTE